MSQQAALNDEDEIAQYTQWETQADGRRQGRSRFWVDGLYCAACAGTIETAALRVDGVLRAEVNGATRRAYLSWDPSRTSPAAMVAGIQAAGYRAFPDVGGGAVERHRVQARRALWQFLVAVFCMMQVMMYAAPAYFSETGDLAPDQAQLLRWASWVLSLPVLLFSAGPFFSGAWRALRWGRISMDVPVALGMAATFIASTGATFDPHGIWGSEVYFDSFTMFVAFLLGGRYLEVLARGRTAQSLDAVLRRLPESVERVSPQGQIERVLLSRLRRGDRVRIAAGQAFVADGPVVAGRTHVDEAMLTGESRPVLREVGDGVVAGSINLSTPVEMIVQALGKDTHYHRIVALMERALEQRPPLVQVADRIAVPFLWGVLVLAALAWGIWHWIEPTRALWIAVSVLIVTCPCALSLAVPSALLAASGVLARRGVLVQRLAALEVLSKARIALLDKTGTLTDHRLQLSAVQVLGSATDEEACRSVALALAQSSSHPLSRAVVTAFSGVKAARLSEVQELPGQGMVGQDGGGQIWRLGALAWLAQYDKAWVGFEPDGDRLAIAVGLSGPAGLCLVCLFEEHLRVDAVQTVQRLQAHGLQVHLVSGDMPHRVNALASKLGVSSWRGGAQPQDKLRALAGWQERGQTVLAVGDGLNDAPLLAQADVSAALGHGAALAQARADFVLVGHCLAGVAWARDVSVQTMRIVRQNLTWAVAYNALCVPLAVLGYLPPWAAGLGMALSSLVVVGNALRVARVPAVPI